MKHLIFSDLDKTLINERYQLTVPLKEIRRVIQALEKKGILFGLCSDSSLPLLKGWQERIRSHGPIVSERGALVFDPSSGLEFATLPEETGWFPSLREEVIKDKMKKLPSWSIYLGDNTELIRQGIRVPGPHEFLLLINSQRRHSFTAHVRRVGPHGQLLIDIRALNEVRREVEERAKKMTNEPLDVDEDAEYGIFTLHVKKNVKANGVCALMDRLGASQITYIGDSLNDLISDRRVKQIAVNNASDEYKKHCSYVASASYTDGVIEILERLITNPLEMVI